MSPRIFRLLLLFGFLLEVILLTFWRGELGIYASAVAFFAVSLSIGVAGIYLAFKTDATALHSNIEDSRIKRTLLMLLFAIFIIIAGLLLSFIFKSNPIQVAFSDIIPQVATMVNRFLSGEFPYQTITQWENSDFSENLPMAPTYLPLQWMPFIPAALLHFDYRWVSFFTFLINCITFLVFIFNKNIPIRSFVIISLLPFILFFTLFIEDTAIVAHTIEIMIASFYLLMSLSIFSRSNALRASGLLLCLLSRYAIVLWVPLYILVLFFTESKRNTILISAICVIGVLVIYVLPFMSVDHAIFANGYAYHSKAALAEWDGQSWQQPGEKPIQLFRGIGFACFFYDFLGGDLMTRLHILQRTHLVISLLTVAVLGFIYFKYKKQVNYKIYLLASLKIYLVIFYTFIQIPYNYLFVTVVVVSLPILAIAMISESKVLRENIQE